MTVYDEDWINLLNHASEIKIYADYDGINSKIQVIDNGYGMSKTQLINEVKIFYSLFKSLFIFEY